MKARPGLNVRNKHVFITGGSVGLGLALAKLCYSNGARVTIVARNIGQLNDAKAQILGPNPKGSDQERVQVRVCDVSNTEMVNEAVHVSSRIQERAVDILFCCAGAAGPGMFADQAVGIHEQHMQVNYLGTVRAIKAVLPHMQSQQCGTIVMVASMAAFFSIPGYTQYSPTKAALKSLAEGLRAELIPQNIGVHVFFPGNIDTPGFEKENKMKPDETREIEGSGTDLVSPENAAKHLYDSIADGEYQITNELFGYFGQSASGMIAGHRNVFAELMLAPLIVIAGELYSIYIAHVMQKSHKKPAESIQQRKTL